MTSPLLELCPELKLQIYEYAICEPKMLVSFIPPGLCFACHETNQTCLPMFFQKHHFLFEVDIETYSDEDDFWDRCPIIDGLGFIDRKECNLETGLTIRFCSIDGLPLPSGGSDWDLSMFGGDEELALWDAGPDMHRCLAKV